MPTKVMEKLSGLLAVQEEPITANQLVSLSSGKRPVALTAIGHLVRLGYATETAGPNRSKLLQHARTFTVRDWENQPDPPVVPGGSQVVPGTSHRVVPGSSPPYGGNGTTDAPPELRVVPDHETPPLPDYEPTFPDWVDQLQPEPASSPDDPIPF